MALLDLWQKKKGPSEPLLDMEPTRQGLRYSCWKNEASRVYQNNMKSIYFSNSDQHLGKLHEKDGFAQLQSLPHRRVVIFPGVPGSYSSLRTAVPQASPEKPVMLQACCSVISELMTLLKWVRACRMNAEFLKFSWTGSSFLESWGHDNPSHGTNYWFSKACKCWLWCCP